LDAQAERAVDKSEDDLARGALDRYQTALRLAQSYGEQVDDQKAQVETLKGALQKLEQKLTKQDRSGTCYWRGSGAVWRWKSGTSASGHWRPLEGRDVRSLEGSRTSRRSGGYGGGRAGYR